MWTEAEKGWMAAAVEEARLGRTSPNPRVGAVIVRDGRVLSIGHHRRAGEAHAEVDAIRNAKSSVAGATLYVTLEPCNHHGRTGPCTDAILEAGISRVVIGCRDPAPHAPGAIDKLEARGVTVDVGLLEAECTALVADFAKHIRTGLPFVTLKAAVTLDGKMATRTGDSKWITGEAARTEAHRMRDDADAVLVGVGTVLADDPALTVRHVEGEDPVRVVLDADLRTPTGSRVLDGGGSSTARTLIFHGPDAEPSRREALLERGAELCEAPRNASGLDVGVVLRALGARDVVRLLVEGGPHVHGTLLDRGFADRAAIFLAPRVIGDARAPSFAAGAGVDAIERAWKLTRTRLTTLGPDWLITGDFERT